MDFNWSCWGLGSGIFGNGGFIMYTLLIILIVFLIYSIFSKKSNFDSENNVKSAYTILKERFARGEITKEQFEEIKKEIN